MASLYDFGTRDEEFQAASSWLSSTPVAANLPNNLKLELYGLYKSIMTSSGPSGSRPSMFFPAPRAKFDAWSSYSAKYLAETNGLDQARERYVEIARGVGWAGEGLNEGDDEDIDLDGIEDEQIVTRKDKGKEKAQGGMGASVSVMSTGDDESERERESSSPIHEAAIENSGAQIRILLAKDPTSINAKDEYGYTPLHLAADRGHTSLVKLLIDSGADRNAQDFDGQTPLALATISDREDVVSILQ